MTDVLDRVQGKVVYAEDVLDLFYVASAGQDKAFIEIVEDVIENTPEADVAEVKHGEWVRYPHGSGIYCSRCRHKRRYRDIHDAYCPHCGAKMKGGDTDA